MKNILKWFFPALSLLIFATLLGTMLMEWRPPSIQDFLSFSLGLAAYSIMLTQVLTAVRPKAIEHRVGLPKMYQFHGWMAMVLSASVLLHIVNQFNGFTVIFQGRVSTTSLYGFIGASSLIFVVLSGVFVLSNTFIKRSKKLMKRKDTAFNRNFQLWLHRLSIVSIIAVYFHITSQRELSSNSTFMFLLTAYTGLTLGWYLLYKLHILSLPKYEVHSIQKPTPTLYELELKPAEGKAIMDYKAGQYVFLRFVDSSVSAESHPFSLASAPEHSKETVQVIIKEAGDFTRTLGKVKPGDKVTLEGPYGNYYPENSTQADSPLALLSGGIGVTPNLSILRHELAQNSNRRIYFVWGLAYQEDLMWVDYFEQLEKDFPNFSYHIIFSNEEVPGYDHGFITGEYLTQIGVTEVNQAAHFYICGPPPMMNAMMQVLADHDVASNRIHLEVFSF